jgi:pyrroline-5-carboxylate reductase
MASVGDLPASLILVGAGKMGGALLGGWAAHGMRGAGVSVLDPQPSADIVALCARQAMALNPAPRMLAPPDVLVLAVKPQMLDAAAPNIQHLVGPETLLLSIVAGKTVANLQLRFPLARAIVRAMPNTPAAVGRGITGAYATLAMSPRHKALAVALLGAVGEVAWVGEERLIDAVTAVSGSGPAYVFHLAECLAKAGATQGLPADLAARLARLTIEGAGELMHRDATTDPATLRRNVTSPGGTTAAALDVLMAQDGLEPLMTRAVAAARRRAEELSG